MKLMMRMMPMMLMMSLMIMLGPGPRAEQSPLLGSPKAVS